MAEAFVAVGSNIDPERHALEAARRLSSRLALLDASTLYRSSAKGRPEQPDYINGVFRLATELPPRELKYGVLRKIEADLGRTRGTDKLAARTIDLDLILYDDLVIHTDGLTLPDPDIYTTPHVAVPLLEIAPDIVLQDRKVALRTLESANAREGLVPLRTLSQRLKGIIRDGRKKSQ
jgi:2-amino-4-hydroxy-6-hydroxymethyldihydropteridine diphosphokinase